MKFENYASRDDFMRGVAAALCTDLMVALQSKPRASLSVPGGSTPGPVFDILAQTDLDWARVDVVLNDERWVGVENPRSNTKLLQERLLQNYAARARLVPLYLPCAQPEEAIYTLSKGVEASLPLSVLLLGMGPDLHTASLFPGADYLEIALSDTAPSVMVLRADAAHEPRITLTGRVLTKAEKIHVLIMGAEKKASLLAAESLTSNLAPINLVRHTALFHWVL